MPKAYEVYVDKLSAEEEFKVNMILDMTSFITTQDENGEYITVFLDSNLNLNELLANYNVEIRDVTGRDHVIYKQK